VCLVSAHHEVGVDTELRTRAKSIVEIANTVFAADELRELLALEGDAQAERAVTLWTLKEAYIKARGMGLALPLDKFAFRFGADVRIEIDASLGDDAAKWQFRTLALGPHVVSTAMACAPAEEVQIVVRDL
jgi:4'-phosphopantetheinyl transferase